MHHSQKCFESINILFYNHQSDEDAHLQFKKVSGRERFGRQNRKTKNSILPYACVLLKFNARAMEKAPGAIIRAQTTCLAICP
jgi:hypothetical protein